MQLISKQYQCTYTPFGEVTTRSGQGTRFGFTGRELDEETGFYYYRARYYDPVTGRFIVQDPIGIEGGDVNFYRYVGNGVLTGRDPSGLTSLADSKFLHQGAKIGLASGAAQQAVTTEIVLMSQANAAVNMVGATVILLTIESKFEGRALGMMATMISGVWQIIEGMIALENQPVAVGDNAGDLATTYLREGAARAVERKERRQCEPCEPPVGSIGCRFDPVPPHDKHDP